MGYKKHKGLSSKTMISQLEIEGYKHTASNFYKLRQVAFKLAKKYRLLNILEDIFQIVLFTACKKEHTYDETKSAFSTYIYVISERVVINTFIRPSSTFSLGKKIYDYSKETKKMVGETPPVSEIASEFGVPEETVVSTFLYHSAKNDYELLKDTFSIFQEPDPLSYLTEIDELFSKGFEQLTDLQRAIIDELIIKESSNEVAAAKLGVQESILKEEYEKALKKLQEYV